MGPPMRIASRRPSYYFYGAPSDVRQCQCASFNRDSQDIPESRRKPILPGMSEEERVYDA
jgi:hypothetical protein